MDLSDWSETGSFKPNLAAQSLNLNEKEGRGVSLGWGCSQASSPSQGEAKWLQQDFFSLWRGRGADVSFHTSPLALQLWCLLPGSWRGGSQPQRLGWRDTICKSHAGKAKGQITVIVSEEILHPLWRTLNQLPQRRYVSGAFRKANNEQAPEQLPLAPSRSRPQPARCCGRVGSRHLLTGPAGVRAGYGAGQLALNPPHSDWEESSVSSSKWEASTQYLHSLPSPSTSQVHTRHRGWTARAGNLPGATCQSPAGRLFSPTSTKILDFGGCKCRDGSWERNLQVLLSGLCFVVWADTRAVVPSVELSVSPAVGGDAESRPHSNLLQQRHVHKSWQIYFLLLCGKGDTLGTCLLQSTHTFWQCPGKPHWRLVLFPICLRWSEHFDGLWKALPWHLVLMSACKTPSRLPIVVKNQQDIEAQR